MRRKTIQIQMLLRVECPDGLDEKKFVADLVDIIEAATGSHVDYSAHTAPTGKRRLRKGGLKA